MFHLFQQSWAIAEEYYIRMYPRVDAILHAGHSLDSLIKKKTEEEHLSVFDALLNVEQAFPDVHADELQVKVERDSLTGLSVVRAGGKNIALIPVIGPLTKYGDLCSLGMQAYQAMISKINSSPSIDGGVIIGDTPGGTVDGTNEFGLAIRNSMKPIGVFADNVLASAGVWFASQADVVVGNRNNPTQIGSIGVLMALPNYQNMIDAGNQPTVKVYRAKQSTEKALVNSIEQIPQSAEEKLQATLDSLAVDFINVVKAGRGDKLDTSAEGLFSGRMFDVYEAKKIGLIDAVGTLQMTINKVAELARTQKREAKLESQQAAAAIEVGTTNANDNSMNPIMKLLVALGIIDAKATQVTGLSEEQATKLSEKVAELQANLSTANEAKAALEARITALEGEKATLETAKTTLTSQITALTEDKTKLEATVAEQKTALDMKPTGTPTTVIPGGNEEGQAADQGATQKEGAEKYRTSIDDQAAQIRESNKSLNTIN